MPWSMVSLFIKPPPQASVQPGMGLAPFQKNLLRRDPLVLIFFFFHRGDNCTTTWFCLAMHHCPWGICLLQVHQLTFWTFGQKDDISSFLLYCGWHSLLLIYLFLSFPNSKFLNQRINTVNDQYLKPKYSHPFIASSCVFIFQGILNLYGGSQQAIFYFFYFLQFIQLLWQI